MPIRPFPRRAITVALAALLAVAAAACGEDRPAADSATPAQSAADAPAQGSGDLLLASTTSTEDSGLLDVLIPAFEQRTGYNVKLISGGSGQAIESARRGDVDVLLVHSPEAEKRLVADGFGIERALVMHNDFVLVGPEDDPAGVSSSADLAAAFQAIAASEALFISRGDESGTHVAELRLWEAAGVDPTGQDWHAETGQGQGATLQVANQRRGYALTDRGTFLAQQHNLDLNVLAERGPDVRNYYHVIVVNPAAHPGVNAAGARAWVAFVTGPQGQEMIRTFGVDTYGEPLFYPDAGNADPTESPGHRGVSASIRALQLHPEARERLALHRVQLADAARRQIDQAIHHRPVERRPLRRALYLDEPAVVGHHHVEVDLGG
jgi:tungstate transport system substrate-binding protein